MDFAYLKRASSGQKLTFIAARDGKTQITFAHLLRGKSSVNAEYAERVGDCIVNDLRYLDYKKMILKSDQEPSMKAR